MSTTDIIPDIHGQIDKLRSALATLGWTRRASGWHHSDPGRKIVFLGDFIDRGPENRSVTDLVRSLIDGGKARAVMGNHELNALQLHTLHPDTGQPLRARSDKNLRQHGSFLAEFPIGAPQTRDVLDWMLSLPLFLDAGAFRAVHACWSQPTIGALTVACPSGVLTETQLIRSADTADALFPLVEEITKGPEHPLPAGYAFHDKDGTRRDHVRVQWWAEGARTWRDIALSVPTQDVLPDSPLPPSLAARRYPASAPPVFFGHYWLSGKPVAQAGNALCLDYSAGKDGPLVTYVLQGSDTRISADQIMVHAIPG